MRKASLTSLWAISLKSMQYLVQKKDHYEVEPLRAWLSFERNRLWLYVCNMPFHMGEASEQNRQHYFEEVNSVLQKCMSCRKVRGSLNFTKGCIASFHILHFFLQEYCFLFKGLPCLQNNYFEVVYFLRKWSCRKWSCRFSGSGGELHSRIGWIFLWKEDCKYSQRNIVFFQELNFFCRRKFRSQIMDRCSDKGERAKR